jgi:HEAT repeat protein
MNIPTQTERVSILAGLEDSDEEVRRMAVEQLALLPDAEAIPRLVECLGDGGWRVRKAAVAGLVACRKNAVVHESLIEALADGENPGRRNSAFEALVACGARVTRRLVRELAKDDADVRKLVIDALAAIGDSDALSGLVEALHDPDPNVRGAAAEALGVVGDQSEAGRLLVTVTEPNEEVLVRLSALRALVRMEARVDRVALGGCLEAPLLRPAALELLGYSEDPAAVDELLKGLSCSRASSREAAIGGLLHVLGRRDGSAAEDLGRQIRETASSSGDIVESSCERLESADLVLAMKLIQFLGLLEDSRAVLPILRAGGDTALSSLTEMTLTSFGEVFAEALEPVWGELDFDARERACRVLGRTRGARAERLLVEALSGPDPELRCEAGLALGRGGFVDRVADLVRALEAAAHDDAIEAQDEVAALVEALVEMAGHVDAREESGGPRIIEMLSDRLGDAPEPVRLAIARVLSRIGTRRDERIIGYLLKDESPAVRRATVKVLALLEFDRAEEPLRLALGDEEGMVRIAAAEVLGESGRLEAVTDLEPLLMDEDPNVAAVALRAVGRLHAGSHAPSDDVYQMIRWSMDASPIIALAGCEALLDMGGPRAGELASRALRRPESDVVRAAVACLGAHGGDDDLGRLIALVEYDDWSVRAEVIQLLVDRGVRRSLPAMLRRLESERDDFVREVLLQATRRLEE